MSSGVSSSLRLCDASGASQIVINRVNTYGGIEVEVAAKHTLALKKEDNKNYKQQANAEMTFRLTVTVTLGEL